MYVLDTDILSELRRRRPNPAVLRWLEGIGWEQVATTALTIMEIRYGIETVRPASATAATAIEGWLDGLLEAGEMQILPFDGGADPRPHVCDTGTADLLRDRLNRAAGENWRGLGNRGNCDFQRGGCGDQ